MDVREAQDKMLRLIRNVTRFINLVATTRDAEQREDDGNVQRDKNVNDIADERVDRSDKTGQEADNQLEDDSNKCSDNLEKTAQKDLDSNNDGNINDSQDSGDSTANKDEEIRDNLRDSGDIKQSTNFDVDANDTSNSEDDLLGLADKTVALGDTSTDGCFDTNHNRSEDGNSGVILGAMMQGINVDLDVGGHIGDDSSDTADSDITSRNLRNSGGGEGGGESTEGNSAEEGNGLEGEHFDCKGMWG